MARLLVSGRQLGMTEVQQVDHTRLLAACASWGQESAWWLHRLARLTVERDALVIWCNRNEDWFSLRFRRRNRRITTLWGLQTVAREKLADIADIVDGIVKKSPRDMSRLTEVFSLARESGAPAVRPSREAIPAAEWKQAREKGWME